MPATVIVNFMTVVHKASNGINFIFPDTCKTPTPAGPIPIPYPNIAMSTDAANGSSSVKMDGNPIMIKSSYYSMSTGDEAGAAMGVVSNKIKGKAYPKMYSFDVKVDGENVFRLLDIMLQNGSSPTNTPPAPNLQPPNVAMAMGQDPDKFKIKKLSWDKADCCCGDEVALSLETENLEGLSVTLNIVRKCGKPKAIGTIAAKIAGEASNPKWLARRGPYQKTVKLEAKAAGIGGPKKSSNELEVKAPTDTKETIGPTTRTTPKFVKQNIPGIGQTWVNSGTNYGWNLCYEIKLEKGQVIVTKKIDFDPQVGASATKKKKSKWKKQIENIWDNKFKLHRTDCKRRDSCDCGVWGCCLFPIRVRCEWGSGHGDKVELHAGANDANGWGSGKWWYSHTWWEATKNVPTTVRAHEFGHLIGMFDEYEAGACDAARRYTNEPSSIMNVGSRVYFRHMKEFQDWFHGKTESVIGKTMLLRM